MLRLASTSRAALWMTAGAIGATVVTGVAFAGNGPSGGSEQSQPRGHRGADASPADTNSGGTVGRHGPAAGTKAVPPPGKGHGFGRPGHGHRFGPLGRTLHGEFVVAGKDGKPVTVRVQTGVVTDVSASSITVMSSDGFLGTYVITADTRIRARHKDTTAKPTSATPAKPTKATAADLSVNDRVWVVATVTGSDANARLIVARSPKDASGDPTVTPPAVFQSSPFGIETT